MELLVGFLNTYLSKVGLEHTLLNQFIMFLFWFNMILLGIVFSLLMTYLTLRSIFKKTGS